MSERLWLAGCRTFPTSAWGEGVRAGAGLTRCYLAGAGVKWPHSWMMSYLGSLARCAGCQMH